MNNLKRIIGPAPSELSREELVLKIRKRQEFVGGLLQRFREQAMAPPKVSAKQPSRGRVKGTSAADKVALGDLMRELKEAGISLEEFKKLARGKGE